MTVVDRDRLFGLWRDLVEIESGSKDGAGVRRANELLADRLDEAGFAVTTVSGTHAGAPHLVAERTGTTRDQVLLLGHSDTVWPPGTLERNPFRIDRGRVFGPGVADMKGGLAVLVETLLLTRDREERVPSRVVITADEELGSATGREVVEDAAHDAAWALVFEPGRPGGHLVDARRGSAIFTLIVEGRTAHIANNPTNGINAVDELAHQILALQSMRRPEVGTSVMAGMIQGGTARQVVPDRAEALIDVRAADRTHLDEVIAQIRAREQFVQTPGARVRVEGGEARPPMAQDSQAEPLRELAQQAAAQVRQRATFSGVGGGSDGNFTAAMGVPTLDGLGPVGHSICSYDEFAEADTAVPRTELAVALLDMLARSR